MEILDWGLIPYEEAMNRQLELVDQVSRENSSEFIVFCRHPSVVTTGRATEAGDLGSWNGEIIQSQRGGRATYHGPEQLVVYPIINLNLREKDLHLHLRKLENALVDCLDVCFGITAKGGIKDATGVWVAEKKIASLGIAVRKWVTYHGMAVNLNPDPLAFSGISPCGFSTSTMTNLSKLSNRETNYESFREQLEPFLLKQWI